MASGIAKSLKPLLITPSSATSSSLPPVLNMSTPMTTTQLLLTPSSTASSNHSPVISTSTPMTATPLASGLCL